MSGAITLSSVAMAATAAAAVAQAAVAYKNGKDQKEAAHDAAKQAAANAKKQEEAAQQAENRANPNRASAGSALGAAIQAGKAGQSGTMLTGPQGVDPAALSLGKNTLLGA